MPSSEGWERRKAKALGLDPDDFRAFYEDALPRVYGYFLQCGGSVAVAEDLTQETFLAAVRELRKGRGVEAPIRWVYGIARHKLIDHDRAEERNQRLRAVAEAELDEFAADWSGDETRERAVATLAGVAAPQRAALVLCYMDGFSVSEVASALGTTRGSIYTMNPDGRHLQLVTTSDWRGPFGLGRPSWRPAFGADAQGRHEETAGCAGCL